jgi:hypothetical protein
MMGVAQRSFHLLDGFLETFDSWDVTVAAPLVRFQLENVNITGRPVITGTITRLWASSRRAECGRCGHRLTAAPSQAMLPRPRAFLSAGGSAVACGRWSDGVEIPSLMTGSSPWGRA